VKEKVMHSPVKMSKIAACVGAGLLALGLSVAVSAPAWAMQIPGDGGGDHPDPGDGPPTHTPVRRLQSFDVRTDSVVATATIAYNGDPGAATVTWGDGTSTSRCLPGQEGPLHSGCLPDPYAGDPSGELVFQHRYATPANGAPFTVAITGRVGNESKTIAIGVTPRYRVTVSDVQFSPLNHCDTFVEEKTEWKLNRGVNGLVPDKEWNFDRVTNPPAVVGDWLPQFEAIAGSGFAVDLTASDNPYVYLHATERDPVFDQDVPTRFVDLNPLLGDQSISVTSRETFTNPLYPDELCQVEYRFDTRVKVLTPGLDSGPVAGQ
jgi:hypothetical protein